jgi:hypothetical protein
MPAYEAWIPTYCTVRWVLETDEPVTNPEELKQRIMAEGEPMGSLCHRCADNAEIDDPGNLVSGADFEVWEKE